MLKKSILCVLVMAALSGCSDDDVVLSQNAPCRISQIGIGGTQCDGDTLVVCNPDTGRIERTSCASVCGFDAIGYYACLGNSNPNDDPTPSGCGSVTVMGRCVGNTAQVCFNGELKSNTCGEGTTCGTRSDGQVDCIKNEDIPDTPDDPVTCTDAQKKGSCNGKILTYCDAQNVLSTRTCESECTVDANGIAGCTQAATSGCGSITKDGTCDGATLKYCKDDKIVEEPCPEKCVIVGDDFAQCYVSCPNGFTEEGECSGDGFRYCDPKGGLIELTCIDNTVCKQGDDGFYACF